MRREVFQGGIGEAHKQGIGVAGHVFYLADAKALAAAGVDAFAHSIRDQPVDAELISAMKAKGIFYVSTFTVDESAFIFADDPSLTQDAFFAAAVPPALLRQLGSPRCKQKVASDPTRPTI